MSLSSFKGNTRSAVSKEKRRLIDITKTVKALPGTIRTSSKQVRHSADNDNGGISYNVDGEGEEVLSDIISQQEQRAFLQEDNANRVEESAERQFSEQKRVQVHLREELGTLQEWKEQQSIVDMVTLRDRQEASTEIVKWTDKVCIGYAR